MAKDLFPLPIELSDTHYGHEAHLCVASAIGFVGNNLEEYKKFVKDAKYVCKHCGRVAVSADNLCEPTEL